MYKDKPTVKFATDNQQALDMVKALGNATRSKFIDIRQHYTKDRIREKKIEIWHVRYEE